MRCIMLLCSRAEGWNLIVELERPRTLQHGLHQVGEPGVIPVDCKRMVFCTVVIVVCALNKVYLD